MKTITLHTNMKTHHSIQSKRRFLLGSLALCLIGLPFAPLAQADIIWSEDFESVTVGSLPTGWSGTAQYSLDYVPVVTWSPVAGNVLLMDESNYAHEPMFSTSVIDFSSYAGQTITLSFDFYNWDDENLAPDTSLIVGFTDSSRRPFDVSTWVGGQGVGAPSGNTIYGPNMQWTTVTLDLTDSLAAFPDTDGIDMKLWAARENTMTAFLDNFVITAVPEPGTAALLLVGLGAGLLAHRKGRGHRGSIGVTR